jgi:nucleoside phosphorylase
MRRTCRRWWLVAWLALVPLNAWALVPVSYRSMSGESWERIAAAHGCTTDTLRAANPGIAEPADAWIRLPAGVDPTRRPAVALMASAYKEIAKVVESAKIGGAYRIVGREFFVGTWNGVPLVAGVAGGNMGNAAIGATILLEHFDVRVMGFVGIAGGGGGARVGDVLIASAAVQNDQGNWYDFQMPRGGVFAGLTWNMRGSPILSDAGRESRLVLVPKPDLLARLRRSVEGLELPEIGADVAAFHGVKPYRPAVLVDGWSASGAQFVTSYHARTTLERRLVLAASRAGLPAPRHFIVDQEDFAAVQAAEEYGVPWFIARVVVDLAAQRHAGAGLPLSLYDTPERISGWLEAHGEQSHSRTFDYSYFYEQIARVAAPIVQEMVER